MEILHDTTLQPDPRVWFDGVFLEAFEGHLGVMMENIPGSWTVTRASVGGTCYQFLEQDSNVVTFGCSAGC